MRTIVSFVLGVAEELRQYNDRDAVLVTSDLETGRITSRQQLSAGETCAWLRAHGYDTWREAPTRVE